MAKFEIFGFDEMLREFALIGEAAMPAAKSAVYKGAGILADQVAKNLAGVLSGESSGDLQKSLGITPIGAENGIVNARVGFDGYGKDGTPNPLKANVLEAGKSDQPARPFMRPAIRQTRGKIMQTMSDEFDEKLQEAQKKG